MKPSELRCFSTSTKEIAIQIHLRGEAHVGLNAGQVIQEFLYLGYWRGCAGVQGCAAKKCFWFLSCLNNTIVHGEVVFDATPIRISEEKTVR